VLVLVTSVGADIWRSRQLRAVAVRTGSPALATDAFHFASDIWATLAVLAGLGAAWVGERFQIASLRYADPLAALMVSLMILRMTVRVGHEAVAALVDEIPAETRAGRRAGSRAAGGRGLLCRRYAGTATAIYV
jgi:divalent metal cation (Fe/Co/Zn/Cd) transporter